MSEPVSVASAPAPTTAARRAARAQHHRRRDLLLGASGLVGGLIALPLAPHGGSPEVTAALAVAAVAVLAGHRWAIGLVVIGALLAWPGLITRIASTHGEHGEPMAAGMAAVVMVPALLSVRRAAALMLASLGLERGRLRVRVAQVAVLSSGLVGALLAT